jgi:hypothetical protein
MKKVSYLLITVCLTILLSFTYSQAQTNNDNPITSNNGNSSSTKSIPGMRELRKIESRNKAAQKRQRAAEQRAEKRAETAAKKREEALEKEEKAQTSTSKTRSTRTSSKRTSNSILTTSVEPANPRPSAGPVDLTGHKKIVNGKEVTVIEMEPKKD